MQNNTIQCFRSRLKTRGFAEIHIRKVDIDRYFVECIREGLPCSAVITSGQMSARGADIFRLFRSESRCK